MFFSRTSFSLQRLLLDKGEEMLDDVQPKRLFFCDEVLLVCKVAMIVDQVLTKLMLLVLMPMSMLMPKLVMELQGFSLALLFTTWPPAQFNINYFPVAVDLFYTL